MRALAAPLLVVLLCSTACGSLPPGGPGTAAPTVAPVVGTDGVTRVRFDNRAGGPAPVVVVPRGATVELTIGSETAERVRVSGLDQVRYVTAGGTVAVRFVALTPGPMTVGLGRDGTVLGTIDVR